MNKLGENRGKGRAGAGRPKGARNMITRVLKDAVIEAATLAGNDLDREGQGGLVGYLKVQAVANPGPYLALLGKVLPIDVHADIDHRNVTDLSDADLFAIVQAANDAA